MSRADLLALTPESVAALANLGLVKRAQREIAAGEGPSIEESPEGVVTGTFPDGTVARLLPGVALGVCPCSCKAPTICRHRVAVALAYPAFHAASGAAAPEAAAAAWSPGQVDDDALRELLGKRLLDRARRLAGEGLVAEVTLGEPAAVPTARLPTCTVRFHVPRDLAYARCDCARQGPCEHLALAVWAFRRAGAAAAGGGAFTAIELGPPHGAEARSDVRRTPDGSTAPAAGPARVAAMEKARALAEEVLLDGVAHASPALAQRFAAARDALRAEGLAWPAAIVDDLEDACSAYHERSARYRPAAVASLLTELEARARAAARPGELGARYVLGAGEPPETPLEHVRLVSLGCRVDADGGSRTAEVLLADPDAAIVLVLSKRFTWPEGEPPEDGPALAHRTVAARVRLGALAHGQLVSRSVRRLANRALVLGTARFAPPSVVPQAGDWGALPGPILATRYDELEASLRRRPPRLLRPRVLAEGTRVLAVASVDGLAYSPGQQAIAASLHDAAGRTVRLVRRHRAAAPHAVDVLAAALAGAAPVRFVAGEVHLGAEGPEIDPVGLVTDRVIVPDLEPAPAASRARVGTLAAPRGPLGEAVREALTALELGAHQGLVFAPSSYAAMLAASQGRLASVGLADCAARVGRLADRVPRAQSSAEAAPRAEVAAAWRSAAVRLSLALEVL